MRRPSSTHGSLFGTKARGPRRWPLVVANAPASGSVVVRATLAFAGSLIFVAALIIPNVPVTLRFVLGAIAIVTLACAAPRRRKTVRASGSSLVADGAGLVRVSTDGVKPIVTWDAPFGVTLLASYGRSHGLLAFTTPTQTRYIPTRIDQRSDADDELFARIAVLADLDLVDGIMHDATLTTEDAAALVRHVEERDRASLGRIFLSDGRGAPIAMDRATLSIASHSFDLQSHLEWRALMFHESTGQAAALYQATWIRQSGAEVVLVAPMPASLVPRNSSSYREASGRLGRALTRDLKLLQSPAEPPPMREIRVAIDRPFMMAVRRILDEAPLASRITVAAPREPQQQGRDSIA